MGWTRHYHSYTFIDPLDGACFGPKSTGAIDGMHSQMRGSFFMDDSKVALCQLLRRSGDRLVYVYDLGDSWRHVLTLEGVVEPGTEVEGRALRGVALLGGEVNCPPEDSRGCDGMGAYHSLLAKGTRFSCPEACGARNWAPHGVRNAFDFDLATHQRRLAEAVESKKSHDSTSMEICTVNIAPIL